MNVARLAFAGRLGNLTSNVTTVRNYAFKSDLKIKWIRPEKVPSYKAEKSGDLYAYKGVDASQPPLMFRNSKELADADEITKKLFSLEFAPRRESARVYFDEVVQKVKRHDFDRQSAEVVIARMTGVIHTFQEIMERFPRNKRLKVRLKEMIDRRKKLLKYMRRWDYKKFEWLIEVLGLVYKPVPVKPHWVARKDSLTKLTNKYCDEIKDQRLAEYREILKAERPLFLQEKINALQFIRDEQAQCGVEVTVTQEEIDGVKEELKQLLDAKNKQQQLSNAE